MSIVNGLIASKAKLIEQDKRARLNDCEMLHIVKSQNRVIWLTLLWKSSEKKSSKHNSNFISNIC
ncbi:hypothetical protein MTR_1g101860 [Medicago truncatula]|uniref:Uncharacterized protein n=1 Tax=Medicago truncatula TaxID=3880 RepID=G7IC26_MEDTR|nr:hypothetical protein MTR_1g101860 [Medicago truncatula]